MTIVYHGRALDSVKRILVHIFLQYYGRALNSVKRICVHMFVYIYRIGRAFESVIYGSKEYVYICSQIGSAIPVISVYVHPVHTQKNMCTYVHK